MNIQTKQDRFFRVLLLARKSKLFLLKVGKNKLLSFGTNTKLFCDPIRDWNVTLNIIHLSLKQTKLL